MVVLGIETATATAAVALADEDGVMVAFSVERGRRHIETLTPAISMVCRSAGVALGDLAAVAVDIGPGLFTGLRVGLGTAQGLGLALGVPLCGASSLEILARGMATSGGQPGSLVIPVVDARRGEVFSARYRVTAGSGEGGESGETREASVAGCVEQVGEDIVGSPEDLRRSLVTGPSAVDEPMVLVGDGARRYAALLGDVPGAVVADAQWSAPPVAVLALLGVARAADGAGVEPGALTPRYLRAADTRINWQTRSAPRPATVGGH